MATPLERVQAIADALFPALAPVSLANLFRWGEAESDAAGRLAEFLEGSLQQKCLLLLEIKRKEAVDKITSKEQPRPSSIYDSINTQFS